jgi:DNA polymerase I-like protein with 3'-5' exonuclease and polymerase domains
MPIQGTAADGMKIAMVRLDAALRERGLRSRMLLQVHDELVFETDADELETLANLATEVMEAALPLDVPLTVDLKVGANWEEMDRLERSASGGWVRAGSAEPEPESEADEALSDALSA